MEFDGGYFFIVGEFGVGGGCDFWGVLVGFFEVLEIELGMVAVGVEFMAGFEEEFFLE